MALRRLICLEKQMAKNKELAEAIKTKINENLQKGFIRKLSDEEIIRTSPRTWYLPVFAVTNKPGKTRLVYDAAAEVSGVSLNNQLLTGPDLLAPLIGVLWRAREGTVAVAGDIKDMFHRVQIRKEDQDSQRFLWRNGDPAKKPDTYVLQVMSFGATCSPSAAQYVKNKNAERFLDRFPRAVRSIVGGHYVDDMFDSFAGNKEALETTRAVIWIHQQAGFEIRGWLSNSPEVMRSLGNPNTITTEMALGGKDEMVDKVLGLYWNVIEDSFLYRLNYKKVNQEVVQCERPPTKREVLRFVMAIYDPLGFASPVLVHNKILLQEIWRKNVDWDEQLTPELYNGWKRMLNDLEVLKNIRIPRCYSPKLFIATRVELHTFVDASEYAFAAVSYLRVIHGTEIDVALVGSKNKVAPTKYLSIPKLELQAAVLGARLADTIKKQLTVEIGVKKFWSDSQTVLTWIKSDHRNYKQFVANRASEILDTTGMKEWNWIPGRKNVADEATKRTGEFVFNTASRWIVGPEFLKKADNEWNLPKFEIIKNCQEEIKKQRMNVVKYGERQWHLIEDQRFSNWWRLLRTCAWIIRFKNKIQKVSSTHGELETKELQEAERILFKKIQRESFPEDYECLEVGDELPRQSQLKCLSPYLDSDDLIRMRGRIDAAPCVGEEFKRPVILSESHRIVHLIIMKCHERLAHVGVEHVVNELRQKMWIPKMRNAVKKCLKECQVCKNRRIQPKVPEMSALPPMRLACHEPPFAFTGLDYFGPMLVAIGRRQEKRYGALFTCLNTRAIHIEMAADLSTDACIVAVRNFMCRRGPPKQIWCDNGTNLRGTETELRTSMERLNQEKLKTDGQNYIPGDRMTEWHFITPRAPHMWGAWERMVRSVKNSIYTVLKEKVPKEFVLQNVLIEAEAIVNSRPLTYLPMDPTLEEALTPNHFLRMTGKLLYTPGIFDERVPRKAWRYSQQIADHFWRRFVLEYLPEVTRRTKWHQQQKTIAVDDVVLIVDECAPRNSWEKAIVQELHPGADGIVRTATKLRKRPVAKLAILDVLNSEKK